MLATNLNTNPDNPQMEYHQTYRNIDFSNSKKNKSEDLYLGNPVNATYLTNKSKSTNNTVNVFLDNDVIDSIPSVLSYLIPSIDKSKKILLLPNNWDTEGSEQYSKITWIKSIKFLVHYAKTLYLDFNIQIDTPKIYEGPKGSIDIIWEVQSYRLLVNIDKNGEDAMFYCDNYKDQTIEGSFKLKHYNSFLLPIATHIKYANAF